MIRNFLLVSLLYLAGIQLSFAQHAHTHEEGFAPRYCSTHEAQEQLLKNNPELAPLIEQAEGQLERFTESFSVTDNERSGSNYIIPVVFHIVHANGSENISDEQIHDAIEILTRDFTLGNADTSGVVPEFKPLIANIGIEFRLARLDPDGNCTNGIIRTVSSLTHEGGENLKNVSPSWPRSNYLNVWVAADLSSGAAGYTYTPGSVDGMWGADIDGIVMKHSYVGSIGTGNITRSRALTHEVGHWLNLRHTWGGTNDPGLEDNCFSDDNVSDTPNTIGWTTCDLGGETCGSLDNVQNYMDYSYCSKMFTEGQKARMLAALNSSTANRNNLHSNSNLVATGVIGAEQLCLVDINSNREIICVGDSVVFTDESYHGVTTRTWSFEGGNPATATGEQVVVYFNEPGTFNVQLEIENESGASISETFENVVKVWPAEGLPLDYNENFESADLDEEWQIINTGTTHPWVVTDDVDGASGSHALMLPNRSLSEGDESEIWSQPIDLSGTNTDVEVTFKYAYARRNPGNNEKLQFWVSSNCGQTWSLRGIWSNNFETLPSYTNSYWVPTSSSHWETVVIDNIPENYLVSNFRFKFTFQSDGGNNFFIDDINITGPEVSGINTSDISSSVAVFPNPARDQVNLTLTGDKAFTFNLQLLNTLGQAVWTKDQMQFSGGSQQFEINTTDLSSGMYLLYLENENGERAIKRIMIATPE